MVSTHYKILVLDSGIGGLSVLREICRQLPTQNFDYLADYAFLPYGGKTEEQLVQRLDGLLSFLDVEKQYSAVVIACNSASTVVLEHLRQHFELPFIGVVPAIKVAAELTENGVIGLLATPGTVEREYTQKLIEDYAQACRVIKLAAPDLVGLAESKFLKGTLDLELLQKVIKPLSTEAVDVCVLGCTHFTYLHDELQQTAPDIRWIDSCDAIARRVAYVLSQEDYSIQTTLNTSASPVFMSTQAIPIKLFDAVQKYGLQFEQMITIDF